MELFPDLPLHAWHDTKQTLHRFEQIVGKVRLHHSPRRNHWWNVPFHLTGSGITSRPMGLSDGNPVFTVDFDFVRHQLVVSSLDGGTVSFPLQGNSVASFYLRFQSALDSLGVNGSIPTAHPFDLPDADRPFAQDREHATYVPEQVTRYWQVLSQVNMVLEEFAGGFSGKTSPVHHFWHTFDIAVTRFSAHTVAQPREAGEVVREAYSREVVSFGFWFGDDNVPEPCFYSYTAPEPEGLTEQPLSPAAAEWVPSGNGHLALLRYADARRAADPQATVLEFMESAYRAGAGLAGWDVEALACPGGATDPYRGGR
ncbi:MULTISPECIES: DUF5996 family protein [Nocardiopsis]|uniref:Ava_C0101 and related proteins n=1 Tax=Nocardiopsis sinuspersici TaxID=501010 RepID=A0A1V3C7L8_9ACTN|nr:MULTISPECIES: DUF5996 family protein [Nocardiopsis]OOC56489.1 hypothetical protein NOSIN_23880 [Nocardiopsis sinuspersici]